MHVSDGIFRLHSDFLFEFIRILAASIQSISLHKLRVQRACDSTFNDYSPYNPYLQAHSSFDSTRCNVFVCDVTCDSLSESIASDSVDLVLLVFVLSAISPEKMTAVLKNIFQVSIYVLF